MSSHGGHSAMAPAVGEWLFASPAAGLFLGATTAAKKVCRRPQPSPSALSLLWFARRSPSLTALSVRAGDSEGAVLLPGRFGPTRRMLAAAATTASVASGRTVGRQGRRSDVRALRARTCAGVRLEAPRRAGVCVRALARPVCVRRASGIAAASSRVVPRPWLSGRCCQSRVSMCGRRVSGPCICTPSRPCLAIVCVCSSLACA